MIRTQGDGGMVSRRLSISTHAVSMAGAALLSFGSFCVPVAAADETADAISKELANPNNDLAKLTFKNQYTFEAYYRLQLLRQVQLVPDVQFIANPANDPSTSSLWVVGLRLRAAF